MKYVIPLFVLLINAIQSNAQTFLWAKALNTPTSIGLNIACGHTGSIYTSGHLYGTVFDMDLGPGVYNLSPGAGMNNAYIAKYNAQGDFVWAKLLFSQDYNNRIVDVKVDAQDNVYILGKFTGTVDFDFGPNTFFMTTVNNTTEQLFIQKMDSNGQFLWAKTIGDSTGNTVNPSFHVADNGHVIMIDAFVGTLDFDPGIGTFFMSSNVTNTYLLMLNTLGDFVWAKQFSGGINSGVRVVSDGQQNIYLVGRFVDSMDANPNLGVYTLIGASSNNNLYVIKLNINADFVWAKYFTVFNPASTLVVSDVMLDLQQHVLFSGSFADSVNFNSSLNPDVHLSNGSVDAFITKMDSAGNYVWTKTLGGSLSDNARQIICDSLGYYYIMGIYTGVVDFDPSPNGIYNLSTLPNGGFSYISKLDSLGNLKQAYTFGTNGNTGGIGANAMAKDHADQIVLTGKYYGTHDFNPSAGVFNLSSPPGGVNHLFISKYNFCGNYSNVTYTNCDSVNLWGTTYTGSTHFVKLFSAVNGCDSNLNVDLKIKHSTSDTLFQTACTSFTYNNNTYTSSGNYTQTYTNAIGCDSFFVLSLTLQNTGNATISQNADTLKVFPLGYTYQWIDCTTNLPIPGATSPVFVPTTSGTYKAVVHFSVECSDTTLCRSIAVGLSDRVVNPITIYPNPSSGIVEINGLVPLTEMNINLFYMAGRMVPISYHSLGTKSSFNISELSNGVYFLEINYQSAKQYFKLVKQ